MAAKKKKNEKDESNEEDHNGTGSDYPVRPGSQGPGKPLDEQLINEWDAENLEMISGEQDEMDPSDDEVEALAEAESSLNAETFSALSPDELDEFDSLLNEESLQTHYTTYESKPPQLRLLDLAEVDEMDQLFENEPEMIPAGQLDNSPVTIIEEEEMEQEISMPERNANLFSQSSEEPPPNFEDRGMGAGFYVSEDELQPTLPEEAEYAPNTDYAPSQEQYTSYEPQSEPGEDHFVPEVYFPPGPTVENQHAPAVFNDLPPNAELVEQQVTYDRVDRLMNRAEQARRRINDEIDSIDLARELLELIRSASTLILSGKDKYEEAERSLNEVEYRLSYSRRVKVWSDAIAYKLLAYEVFWLMTLGLGALFIPSALSTVIGQINTFSPNSLPEFIMMDDLFLGISTALWGGLGGVVGAMYALWRHVSLKQDFNPQHKMWYYTQPIMGIPIGVVVFLLVRIGIGFTVEGVLNFSSPYAIYMVAWIAGFQQNILYEIIRQMLKIFRFQS